MKGNAQRRLDSPLVSLHYSPVIRHLPLPLRRLFAVLASWIVLFAPVTQLAHAQAMLHDAGSAHAYQAGHAMPGTHHHHGTPHHHGATCCDFCPGGCQSVALPADIGGALATQDVPRPVVPFGKHLVALPRTSHVLPFPLGPPASPV